MNENGLKSGISRIRREIPISKKVLSDLLDDGRAGLKHVLKRTRHGAEDFIDETGHSIKRAPFRSVAFAFGAGALLAALISRNGNHHHAS